MYHMVPSHADNGAHWQPRHLFVDVQVERRRVLAFESQHQRLYHSNEKKKKKKKKFSFFSFSPPQQMVLTTLTALVLVGSAAAAASDFCKSAANRDRVRCDGHTLTWCKGDEVGATRACGTANCVDSALANSPDAALNAVPSYCKQLTKEFFMTSMGPEREKKWSCRDVLFRLVVDFFFFFFFQQQLL
jgi:hypothetical protein